MSRIFDIAALIVLVALATTLTSSPNTAPVIKSVGDAFSGSLRAAQGH